MYLVSYVSSAPTSPIAADSRISSPALGDKATGNLQTESPGCYVTVQLQKSFDCRISQKVCNSIFQAIGNINLPTVLTLLGITEHIKHTTPLKHRQLFSQFKDLFFGSLIVHFFAFKIL